MDLLANLWLGFSVAVTPTNLLFCLIGALVGTLIGVLPGIGPLATISMLLPLTYHFEPVTALIMLAGIYYGAQYGGSTTAILVNLPGETSSVVTTLDGHQMARQGRAGAALAIAALGSFFAGSVATLFIAVASPPLAELGLQFQAPEYFALTAFCMVLFGDLLALPIPVMPVALLDWFPGWSQRAVARLIAGTYAGVALAMWILGRARPGAAS